MIKKLALAAILALTSVSAHAANIKITTNGTSTLVSVIGDIEPWMA